MTETEAETRINEIYRKKLSQYPYLAPEILQHGAKVRDLYGFNNLLNQDSALLKEMEKNKGDSAKAFADETKTLKAEMAKLSLAETSAMVEESPGEFQFSHVKARMLIDNERVIINLRQDAAAASKQEGFNKDKILRDMPYKSINKIFEFTTHRYDVELKNLIAKAMRGKDEILGTKDDDNDAATRAVIVSNIENFRISTKSRLANEFSPWRVGGAENLRVEGGYKNMMTAIDNISTNYKNATSKSILKDISDNTSAIIAAVNAKAVFQQYGTGLALQKALLELMPDEQMLGWLRNYYIDESGQTDPERSKRGKEGLVRFHKMIDDYIKTSEMSLEEARLAFTPNEFEGTSSDDPKRKKILPGLNNKIQEMTLYTIENNTTAPGDNRMINKYLDHINDNRKTGQDRYNTSVELIQILANGTLTEGRIESLKDEGLVKTVNGTKITTKKGLLSYIEKNPNTVITQNSDTNLLTSTDETLNNNYLKVLNNIYQVEKRFNGKVKATEEYTNFFNEIVNNSESDALPPLTDESETTTSEFDGTETKVASLTINNLGNIKDINDLKKFKSYPSRAAGIIDAANLATRIATGKHKNHIGKIIDNVKGIIDIWRPEKDWRGLGDITQEDYINKVSTDLGVNSTDKIDLSNKEVMATFLKAVFDVEGKKPEATIEEILDALSAKKVQREVNNERAIA